jgi:hypothetical protein
MPWAKSISTASPRGSDRRTRFGAGEQNRGGGIEGARRAHRRAARRAERASVDQRPTPGLLLFKSAYRNERRASRLVPAGNELAAVCRSTECRPTRRKHWPAQAWISLSKDEIPCVFHGLSAISELSSRTPEGAFEQVSRSRIKLTSAYASRGHCCAFATPMVWCMPLWSWRCPRRPLHY